MRGPIWFRPTSATRTAHMAHAKKVAASIPATMATLVSGRASDSRIKIHLLDFEFSGALTGLDDDVDEHVQ